MPERVAVEAGEVALRTLLLPAPLAVGEVALTGSEAHHGGTVLRLRSGDRVRVADGVGRVGTAEVMAVGRGTVRLAVTAVEALADGPAAFITVACAVPKGGRFDELVRGLTELGVGGLRPLRCERGERVPANLDRQRRVAVEALKQCRRARLPELGPAVDIPGLAVSPSRLIILDRAGGSPQPGEPRPTILVVGPEGGFTEAELGALVRGGAARVRLARTVLRIETAALAATAVWVAAWEAR